MLNDGDAVAEHTSNDLTVLRWMCGEKNCCIFPLTSLDSARKKQPIMFRKSEDRRFDRYPGAKKTTAF